MPLLLRLLRRVVRLLLVAAVRWVVRAIRVARGSTTAGGSRGPRSRRGAVIDVEPQGLFDRFTDDARRVVADSVDLARRDGRPRAEIGHLVLALLHSDTVAAAVLREHGVEPDAIRRAVAGEPAPPGPGPGRSASGAGPVSASLAQVLQRAPRSARSSGRFDVGPRDLLHALAAADPPPLRTLLRDARLPQDTLRRAVGL